MVFHGIAVTKSTLLAWSSFVGGSYDQRLPTRRCLPERRQKRASRLPRSTLPHPCGTCSCCWASPPRTPRAPCLPARRRRRRRRHPRTVRRLQISQPPSTSTPPTRLTARPAPTSASDVLTCRAARATSMPAPTKREGTTFTGSRCLQARRPRTVRMQPRPKSTSTTASTPRSTSTPPTVMRWRVTDTAACQTSRPHDAAPAALRWASSDLEERPPTATRQRILSA
mmetsp:Transcript_26431/g.61653  ORF Transcript_26431/g.61653 Transcript_26431/m.61653 type:complete len:226 (-) Transcript_26431:960-1637(-)